MKILNKGEFASIVAAMASTVGVLTVAATLPSGGARETLVIRFGLVGVITVAAIAVGLKLLLARKIRKPDIKEQIATIASLACVTLAAWAGLLVLPEFYHSELFPLDDTPIYKGPPSPTLSSLDLSHRQSRNDIECFLKLRGEREKERQRAGVCLERALNSERGGKPETYALLLALKGQFCLDQERNAEAARALEQASSLDQQNPTIKWLLLQAYQREIDNLLALEDLPENTLADVRELTKKKKKLEAELGV